MHTKYMHIIRSDQILSYGLRTKVTILPIKLASQHVWPTDLHGIRSHMTTMKTLISTDAAAALTRLASTPASFSLGHFVTTFWWHRLCTTHVHTTKQTPI